MRKPEEQHYCRHCEQAFAPTPGKTPSAHVAYVLHSTLHHPVDRPDQIQRALRCDKNCQGHEQPDEKQHGVKLYGPGAARISQIVPPLLTAEEIFGPED